MSMYTGLVWRRSVLFTRSWNHLTWITFCSNVGKYSTDEAKMMGMTPAWFTLSGMYVLWPPIIRRPTIRFAYWTGIRRWPCSVRETDRRPADDGRPEHVH